VRQETLFHILILAVMRYHERMKLLVFADRPPHQSLNGSIAKLCQENNIDLIVTLGDLEFADIQELAGITNIPKIGVYGNHCSGTYMEPLGIHNLHLRTGELGGVTFGGFGGSVRYKEGSAPMYTQEQAAQLLHNFPRVDVFLSHCPPYGINDEPDELAHQGFHALRQYLDEQQPKVWLHGHTYPKGNELVTQHGPTRIEYVFGHKIIEL
jgi:Icc-related predicted phosphoesterase